MSSENSEPEPKASDSELLGVLRMAKDELGIPALATSQFNEIGGYDYSNQGLNDRLFDLHENGYVGHQKVAGRHLWWHSAVGDTDEIDVKSIEEITDTDSIDAERFSREKAEEIAKENIPQYERNYWQRVAKTSDGPLRVGAVMFLGALGLSISGSSVDPTLTGSLLIAGMLFVGVGFGLYLTGIIGQTLSKRTKFPDEPFESDSLLSYLAGYIQ